MKLSIERDWFERHIELEGDLEIGAGFSLVAAPPGCNPGYNGCHCACHRSPGMMHIVACCAPKKFEATEIAPPHGALL